MEPLGTNPHVKMYIAVCATVDAGCYNTGVSTGTAAKETVLHTQAVWVFFQTTKLLRYAVTNLQVEISGGEGIDLKN